jgi:hypothetical protein
MLFHFKNRHVLWLYLVCSVEQNLVQVNSVLLGFIDKTGERGFYHGQLTFLVDYFNLIWEVLVICSL